MSKRIQPIKTKRSILDENFDSKNSKKPITEVYYLNELASVKRSRVKDLGLLEPPWPPAIGMDKMRTRSRWLGYLVDCAHGSSIHGLKHLVAPRRHPFEKFLFVLILLGSMGGLALITLDSWRRYRTESTSLVLDNNFRKFEISKPSVTICPMDLLDDQKFPEVFQKYGVADTNETREFMTGLSRLRYGNIRESVPGTTQAALPAPDTWLKLLYELRARVKLWNEYADEFAWTSTERGLCMLFGSELADHLDVESWISDDQRRPNGSRTERSRRSSARLRLDDSGVIKAISSTSHNFWIGFHHPNTVIDYSSPGKSIYMLRLNTLSLKVSEVSTSERVQSLSVQQRNCKLPSDAGLSSWPVYSSVLCQLECRHGTIRNLCGCLPHFAKPMEGVPTCDARQLLCLADNLDRVLSSDCGCMRDCDEALYVDQEYTSFLLKEGSPADAVLNLNIDFPQVKYVHEELYGFTDFLASVGGAAGLFLGASVVSLYEIAYFFALGLLLRCRFRGEKSELKCDLGHR